jgi:hypothetical protein
MTINSSDLFNKRINSSSSSIKYMHPMKKNTNVSNAFQRCSITRLNITQESIQCSTHHAKPIHQTYFLRFQKNSQCGNMTFYRFGSKYMIYFFTVQLSQYYVLYIFQSELKNSIYNQSFHFNSILLIN